MNSTPQQQKAVRPAPAPEANTANDHITVRIKGLMGQRDLSRRALAEHAAINHVTLGRRLIGQQSWDIDMLERIADVFDVDLNWLLTGAIAPDNPEGTPGGGSSLLSGLNRRHLAYKASALPLS